MHKIYLKSCPPKIARLVDANPEPDYNRRRDPEIFRVPSSRLKALDKTFSFKGPRLYNRTANEINKQQTSELKVERRFLNSFKSTISRHLLTVQNTGGEEWVPENFILYE